MASDQTKPVIIVGAGPVGLTAGLAAGFHGLPFALYEEDAELSVDAKAGTVLTRSLEAYRRYGVADAVLDGALRLDEIGAVDRASDLPMPSVYTAGLAEETRYPFLVNLPQHHLEPVLARALEQGHPGAVHMRHSLTGFRQNDDGVVVTFDTPVGPVEVEGSYLLACDGGRSAIRGLLGITVEGVSHDARYMLVDFELDIEAGGARGYPYLSYFADPVEWMVLVRQPHCWRLVFPLAAGAGPTETDELHEKVRRFVGEFSRIEVLKSTVYRVHHRIATEWQQGRVFLLGDAAHLITPMWALGMNTGILDVISLIWRLAWVARGWAAPALLEGYAREQRLIAARGSAALADAASEFLGGASDATGMSDDNWNNAMTRTLLGVRLDVDGGGDSALVRRGDRTLQVGDRLPDALLHGPGGRPVRLHDLSDDSFVALYITDLRQGPDIPEHRPGLRHYVVSRWDAPLGSGLRDRSLFDVGGRLAARIGCPADSVVLVRPDDHVAAIVPMQPGVAETVLARILG